MFLFIFSEDGETDDNLEDEGDDVEDISLDISSPESLAVLAKHINSLAKEVFDDEDEGVGEMTAICLELKTEVPPAELLVKSVDV